MGRLDGRVAIVTGASRGLGRAIAVAFADEGAAVAVAARTEQQWDERLPGTIRETVAEIETRGGRAVAVRADLFERADRARLVEETRRALGPVTLLVNNAAFTAPGRPPAPGDVRPAAGPSSAPRASAPPARAAGATVKAGGGQVDWPTFLTTPLRAYERHFMIGPFAAYELMQLVVPDMTAAGHGAVVNITSGASRMPGDGPYPDRSEGVLAGYGGSKAALEHLTRTAGYELADRNIAVNALSPSKAIATPGVQYYSKVFGDVAPPEDFAEAAVLLALADPSRITGKVVGHAEVLDGSYRPYER
jgi:NAD(P)-dependent dehydrogenase (short-subunit alcohol dehydrogenase family)